MCIEERERERENLCVIVVLVALIVTQPQCTQHANTPDVLDTYIASVCVCVCACVCMYVCVLFPSAAIVSTESKPTRH